MQGLRPFAWAPFDRLRTGREGRGLLRTVRLGFGDFGLRTCFGFRASDFVLDRLAVPSADAVADAPKPLAPPPKLWRSRKGGWRRRADSR